MTETAPESSSGLPVIKPSRGWYAVAAVLFIGSLVPAFFLARSGLRTIDLSVDPVTDGTITVHDERLSVFAPSSVSAPGLISCTLSGPGGDAIPLDEPSTDVTIDSRERVGRTPDGLPEGTYRLSCRDGSGAIDASSFGTRSTAGWTEAIVKLVASVVVPGIAGLVAITIAVITAIRRSSARRRAIHPPAPPGYPGYPPPRPPPAP